MSTTPMTVEQFLQELAESGLMSSADITALKHDPGAKGSAESLAASLVASGQLTEHQVRTVLKGEGRTLVLGNYVVLDRIGAGGMGVVLKARHRRMDRIVALKLLPKSTTESEDLIRRFHREVKAAARLNHPHIVTAYDADEAKGVHFYVMEYIEGDNLATLVRRQGPLPVAEALDCVLQAASGLQYAHSAGVVHRDIKPSNLLIDRRGTVRILDMGLARIEAAESPDQTELTGSGQIMGTIDFMAPEQALDTKHADARADIYSLGATLNFLLTGRPMLPGDTHGKKMQALLSPDRKSTFRLQAQRPDAGDDVERVFQKMVARDPKHRFQTMEAVIGALQPVLHAIQPDTAARRAVTTSGAPPRSATKPAAGTHSAGKHLRKEQKAHTTALAQPPTVDFPPETFSSPAADATQISPGSLRRKSRPGGRSRAKSRRQLWIWLACVLIAIVITVGTTVQLLKRDGTLAIELPREGIGDLIVEVDGTPAEIISRDGLVVRVSVEPGRHNQLLVSSGGLRLQTELDTGFQISAGAELPVEASLIPALPAVAPFSTDDAAAHQSRWSVYLNEPVEIENSIGMTFRLIPPGEFIMGSTTEQISQYQSELQSLDVVDDYNFTARINLEKPQHAVELTRPFYIGTHEVTQSEYWEVMQATPSHFSSSGAGSALVAGMDVSELPVETVGWLDALEFCNRLSVREGLTPCYEIDGTPAAWTPANGYRLPTEAEWEFAVRAGSTGRYFYGESLDEIDQYAWHVGNSELVTQPVGSKRPNPFGLYDVYGNVWEWCFDAHFLSFYTYSPITDPMPPQRGATRMARGSSFDFSHLEARSAARGTWEFDQPIEFMGFRVVRTIEAAATAVDLPPDAVPPDGAAVEALLGQSDDWEWSLPVSVGSEINTEGLDQHPWVSDDEQTLIFAAPSPSWVESGPAASSEDFDLWMSTRASREQEWSEPVHMGLDINSASRDWSPFLAANGQMLLFASKRDGGMGAADLWMSRRIDTGSGWTQPENLGDVINTTTDEGWPCLTDDGCTLLFTSGRTGGFGQMDIWMATRESPDAPWSAPANLGLAINSTSDDGTANLSRDGLMLLFFSDRYQPQIDAGILDTADMYVSTRESLDAAWSPAQLIARPINSTSRDTAPFLSADGRTLYFESDRGDGEGRFDIWESHLVPKRGQ